MEGSVDYIHHLIANGICQRCNFYQAEWSGILQGAMTNTQDVATNTVKGCCPPGLESVPNDCPEWDANCGCHGPIMTKGSVAWVAGQLGGPDFFIDMYDQPANWWGTQHTNFGFIEDLESLEVICQVWNLPVHRANGMTYLEQPIHFDTEIISL